MSEAAKLAFRCRHCGHLEHAAHAGECSVPRTCRVCRHGIKYDPDTGEKTPHPENWEVLHDAADDRLAELGLTRAEVCRHAGKGAAPAVGKTLAAALGDGPGTADGA